MAASGARTPPTPTRTRRRGRSRYAGLRAAPPLYTDERRTQCSAFPLLAMSPHEGSRPYLHWSFRRLHTWHRRSIRAASNGTRKPAGMGSVVEKAAVTAAARVAAETVAVAMVVGTVVGTAVAVMVEAAMAEGTAAEAKVAVATAAEKAVAVKAAVGKEAAKVVEVTEAETAECRTPRQHSNALLTVHRPRGSQRSCGCCPLRPRAAHQAGRERTPPMSRPSHSQAGSLCCERPSARSSCKASRHTARSAGTPRATLRS